MSTTATSLRLEIDWTRCDGHGLCARLLPERLGLDQDGFPILIARDVPEELEGHARRAVSACPRLALRLDAPTRGVASVARRV